MSSRTFILVGVLAATVWFGAPFVGATVLEGQMGGNVVCTISDTSRKQVACHIVVPDSFTVHDLDMLYGRVVVLVGVERESAGASTDFVTEAWQFAPSDTSGSPLSFADRRVLKSEESALGESYAMYEYAVCCDAATAVYRQGWEWGSTLLFDASGRQLPLDDNELHAACGFRPDFVRPVAWVERNREWRLILLCSEYGGDQTGFVSYWQREARLERVQGAEIDGVLVAAALHAVLRQK